MRVPSKVRTFKEHTGKTYVRKYRGYLTYTDGRGRAVDVLLWHRWPSYDFIFGVPAKTNPLRGVEAGFFQYRDTRKRNVSAGFYVDRRELEILVEGFTSLLKEK